MAVRKHGQASVRDPLVERLRRAEQHWMVLAAHKQQRGHIELGQSLVGGGVSACLSSGLKKYANEHWDTMS